MNARCYKTVFSKRLGARVAVGEHASSQGKATGASSSASTSGQSPCSDAWAGSFWGALSSTFALVALVWATPAWAQPATHALPTGGQVVQGAVQFNQSAQQLNIHQSTDRAAINWQRFDIGAAAKVNIQQPSAQSVLLNRVGGESPSQIFGQLTANGQVILVNPNGMVFGKDGSVSAAGFTGSTLHISDADFMAGKERYTRTGTAASTSAIVNRGLIQAAPGGYVALLGASVSNEGRIEAPQGNVFMAAADAVTLPSPTVGLPIGQSGRIRLELTPASINAAVANHKGGTIVTEGGQVYLQAAALNQAMATVLQSGSIDTTGVQGGQVHVLADGGRIRVDGQIKANSTNGSAGGDIYIGRDKDTNVLAAVGDASGAKLESKGGFVETSGQYLATTGTRVTAKEWLLDPTDINIVAIGTATPETATVPGSGLFQDTTGISASEVLKADIEAAINAGTSVTISTANPTAGANGSGNITIATALSFDNQGNQPANLKLFAINGITQNANASITTVAGSKTVNIDMESLGRHMGVDANSASSRGIVINSAIEANGIIKIDGFNRNTGGNSVGVTFNAGSSIKAASFDIKGSSNVTGASSPSSHGVLINGNTSFTSTSTTVNSQINGTSRSNASGVNAGTILIGTNIRFNAGDGKIIVKGSNEMTQMGLRISPMGETTTVVTDGHVTLGALEANSDFSMRAGSITANSGSLNILGSSVSNFGGESITANNGASINIEGITTAGSTSNAVSLSNIQMRAFPATGGTAGTINITGAGGAAGVRIIGGTVDAGTSGDVTITGTATNGSGVNIENRSIIKGRDITINGTANASTSGTGVRFHFVTGPSSNLIVEAERDLKITGTLNASPTATGSAVRISSSLGALTGGGVLMSAKQGQATITGIQNGNANNTSSAVYLTGFKLDAKQDIKIQAKAANSNSRAIHMNREAGVLNDLGFNMTVRSTDGNVLIQSNQGAVLGQDAGTVLISGRNVTLDNTGAGMLDSMSVGGVSKGSIDNTTGAIVLGDGTSTFSTQVTNWWGTSWVPLGVSLGRPDPGGAGNNSTAGINATGNLTIGGSSSAAQGVVIGTAITVGGNINLAGRSTNSGNNALDINAALTSTGGDITLSADTMKIDAAVKAGNTGANTVTVKTVTAANKIDIGSVTGTSGVDAAGTLGLSQAELNRIMAGKFIIGDNGNTGGIKVSETITTQSATGNVELLTGGNIDFAGSFTTGGSGEKNLTLRTSGSSSNVTAANAAVISTRDLLITSPGDDRALVSLGNGTHQIDRLAAKVKSIDLQNGRALIVGNVEGTPGVDAQGNVKLVAASSTSARGIKVDERINTSTGNVSLIGTSATGIGVHLTQDVQTQAGSTSLQGTSNGSATGVLVQLPTNGSQISATQGVLIEGSSATGVGVDLDGGFLSSADFSPTPHNFGTGNAIYIKGSTGTDSATVAGVRLNDITVANWNSTGKIVIEATKGALVSTADAKITQNANANVELSTDNLGHLSAAKIIKNSTGAGDIILSAGKSLAAGNDNGTGTGGQVKPVAGNTITNNGSGKLLVYTGNVTDTGVLNRLSSTFNTLHIAGTQTNTGFNRAFGANLTNGPAAQVLFRQNTFLPTVSGNLAQATLTRNYNAQTVAQNGDLAKLKDALKAANTGNFINTVGSNNFGVAKADVINLLALDTASNNIKNVNRDGSNAVVAHTLTLDTSAVTNPTTGLSGFSFSGPNAQNVALMINPKVLAVNIDAVQTQYGTTAATGAASISGQETGDQVFLSGSTSLVNAAFSSSNRLRAGTYQQTVGAALGGADAGNYTVAPTTVANYVVTPKVINASVTAADKVYDGNMTATLRATSADILAGDTVNVTGLMGNFASRNVARDGAGNVVAQAVTVTGSGAGLGGADGANYVLGNAASVPATTARITPRELKVSGITAADKVYDGTTAAVVSVANAALANVVAGDNVGVNSQNAQGNFADKNVARNAAGQVLAKAVRVSGLQLQGTDAGNYSLSNDASASAQASITPRTVSLSGNTALDKVVDGTTTAQVRAGSLSGLLAGESLSVNAQGEFEDALQGNNKVVNARFALQDGASGLAGNYQLSNPVEVLRASILAFVPGSVDPGRAGSGATSGSRISFAGGSGTGAATGVSDEPINPELVEQCSVLNPEKCECEDTKIPGVELCFAPTPLASLKD